MESNPLDVITRAAKGKPKMTHKDGDRQTIKTVTLVGNTVCIKESDFDCLMGGLHENKTLKQELEASKEKLADAERVIGILREALEDAANKMASHKLRDKYLEIALKQYNKE